MTFALLHIVRNLDQQAHSAKTSRDNGDHKTNRGGRFVRDSPSFVPLMEPTQP